MVIERSHCNNMYSCDQEGTRHNMTSSLYTQAENFPTGGYHDNYRGFNQGQIPRYPGDYNWGVHTPDSYKGRRSDPDMNWSDTPTGGNNSSQFNTDISPGSVHPSGLQGTPHSNSIPPVDPRPVGLLSQQQSPQSPYHRRPSYAQGGSIPNYNYPLGMDPSAVDWSLMTASYHNDSSKNSSGIKSPDISTKDSLSDRNPDDLKTKISPTISSMNQDVPMLGGGNTSQDQSKEPFEWMKPKKYPKVAPQGKTRTRETYRQVYSDAQRLELEKEYLHTPYITQIQKQKLAARVHLKEKQVKNWFQNRRAKDRKIMKEKVKDPSKDNKNGGKDLSMSSPPESPLVPPLVSPTSTESMPMTPTLSEIHNMHSNSQADLKNLMPPMNTYQQHQRHHQHHQQNIQALHHSAMGSIPHSQPPHPVESHPNMFQHHPDMGTNRLTALSEMIPAVPSGQRFTSAPAVPQHPATVASTHA